MIINEDPVLIVFRYFTYLVTYIFYVGITLLERISLTLNIILALIAAFQCLLIVGILVEKKLKSDYLQKLDVGKLLDVWKTILTAISLYALREGYGVLEAAGVLRIIYGYDLLGILFSSVLIIGLYDFHRILAQNVERKEVAGRLEDG